MKSSRKSFILSETILAAVLVMVAVGMLRERSGRELERVSVIIQNPESSQWSAFKYGLRMAAEDFGMEMSVVGTEGELTAAQEEQLMERELENGTDAVIVQLSQDGAEKEMLKKMEKKLPVMLVESAAEDLPLPCTSADNYAMGKALAEALLEDCSGSLKGKTLGLIAEAGGSEAVKNRQKGLCEAIQGRGGEILWSVSALQESKAEELLQEQTTVDFIIALDDRSLVWTGKEAAARNLHGALVYGIGSSTEAVYYVDSGSVQSLVVPDGFNIGYQAFSEVADKLKSRFYKMQDRTVSHTVMRRENLFSKENQEILFTMNQ